jgi:hypothetical protein
MEFDILVVYELKKSRTIVDVLSWLSNMK